MRAGELRHRITIQKQATSQDEEGVSTVEWIDLGDVWALVKDRNGRELTSADRNTSEISIEILIRYQKGINSSMRVLFGIRIFDIQAVIPDERMKEMRLLGKEVI